MIGKPVQQWRVGRATIRGFEHRQRWFDRSLAQYPILAVLSLVVAVCVSALTDSGSTAGFVISIISSACLGLVGVLFLRRSRGYSWLRRASGPAVNFGITQVDLDRLNTGLAAGDTEATELSNDLISALNADPESADEAELGRATAVIARVRGQGGLQG